MKSESKNFTYQTRLLLDDKDINLLSEYSSLFGKVERTLFHDLATGKKVGELKTLYLKKFGITARQFNSVRSQIEGKIASCKEVRTGHIQEKKRGIIALEKSIKKLKNTLILHQKKRRLGQLQAQLQALEEDATAGRVRICFGSRKLFRAQFQLQENGYASHDAWYDDWLQARNSSFFLIGSKDEVSGNQSCTATLLEDGSLGLRLRLPDALSMYGKYLHISNIRFRYGHEAIVSALEAGSVAISYRFKRDKKGWTVFATIPCQGAKKVTRDGFGVQTLGVLGVDINADHLAVTETDRYGNPIQYKKIPCVLYGKSQNQAKALIGDAAKDLVAWSARTEKPVVIEQLDFQKKKAELRETGTTRYRRMLSSFSYNSIITSIQSRAFRYGVHVKEVNPAYSSLIGRAKFCKRYGISIHQSAALTLGRRYLRFSERLPRHLDAIHDGKNGYVAFSLPARNREKHVWSLWRQVQKKLPTVLAAHFRPTFSRSSGRKTPAC